MSTPHAPQPDEGRHHHTFVVCDALEKVFLDAAPRPHAPVPLTSYLGERASFQLAWLPPMSADLADLPLLTIAVDPGPGVAMASSRTRQVPVQVPAPEGHDEGYLRTTPGLYPDLLEPLPGGARRLKSVLGSWQSAWFDLTVEDARQAGRRGVRIRVFADYFPDSQSAAELDDHQTAQRANSGTRELLFETSLDWVVRGRRLPELDIIMTQWFHVDSLADFYGFETYSEEHWESIEHGLHSVRSIGANSVLTPLFTPPLDVKEGSYRRNCQLLMIRDSTLTGARTEFDFTLLDRWISCCERAGLTTLEMPPLFTQWGAAAAAPWWVLTEKGYELRFGWHTPAATPSYRAFLGEVLPATIDHLRTAWPKMAVVWHVSDEPTGERLAAYRIARDSVKDYLVNETVVDAVSDPAFVAAGAIGTPVIASDAVARFHDMVADFWVYYCNAQHRGVSNRFIAMPGVRTRAIGRQLFNAGAKGFLHWGFNYWYAQLSEHILNPFQDTTAGGAFPGGDAFVVYPGPGGSTYESIRHRHTGQAMNDHQALQLLRELAAESIDLQSTMGYCPPESSASRAAEEWALGPHTPGFDYFSTRGMDPVRHLQWRWRLDETIDSHLASGGQS